MSLNINAALPWLSLVHHHLLIYDQTGPAWKLFQSWKSIIKWQNIFMTQTVRFISNILFSGSYCTHWGQEQPKLVVHPVSQRFSLPVY